MKTLYQFSVLISLISCSHNSKILKDQNEVLNCQERFETIYIEKISKVKMSREGKYESDLENNLRGLKLVCGFDLKKLEEESGLYEINLGRDTEPRGNPRKIYIFEKFKLIGCNQNSFDFEIFHSKKSDANPKFSIHLESNKLSITGNLLTSKTDEGNWRNFSCSNLTF